MTNKKVLITGSTDGIGKQTAIDLAHLGAEVIIHGRNAERLQTTRSEIINLTGNHRIEIIVADLTSLQKTINMVGEVNNRFENIDVLVNNAGVYMNREEFTEDGFEKTFAVNHLSHFLLTKQLLDSSNGKSISRIINVSSVAHTRAQLDFDNLNSEKQFDAYNAYAVSKLANVLFTYELAKRLQRTNIMVNSFHPGVISTKLLWEGFSIKGNSLAEGAATSVYLASSDDVKGVSGKYFVRKKITDSSRLSYDNHTQLQMWKISEQMINKVVEKL